MKNLLIAVLGILLLTGTININLPNIDLPTWIINPFKPVGPSVIVVTDDKPHLLIVDAEVDQYAAMPKDQLAVLRSLDLKNFYKEKGIVWQQLDKDTTFSADYKIWDDAMQAAKKKPDFKTPYMIYATKKGNVSQPLPLNLTEMQTILNKYL